MNERQLDMVAIENDSDTDAAQGSMNENVALAVSNERQDDIQAIETGPDTALAHGSNERQNTDAANGTIKHAFKKI